MGPYFGRGNICGPCGPILNFEFISLQASAELLNV